MNTSSSPVLAVRHVSRRYRTVQSGDEVVALAPMSLDIHRGDRVGVVGESGSGKTTLIRLLAGLDRPTTGTVEFRNAPLDTVARHHFRRAVQVVFQDPRASLDPAMSVGASIAEPVACLRRGTNSKKRAEAVAALVGLEPALLARRPVHLSGGQCQRAAIARAIACEPEVLLADEPVSALDAAIREEVLDVLDRLTTTLGTALVVVSHDLSSVVRLCRDVLVLHTGTVVARGPIGATLGASDEPHVQRLMTSLPRLETR